MRNCPQYRIDTLDLANKNGGTRNPKISIQVTGEPVTQLRKSPLVWLFLTAGPLSGGIHTTLKDAKRLRKQLDLAISEAETDCGFGWLYNAPKIIMS